MRRDIGCGCGLWIICEEDILPGIGGDLVSWGEGNVGTEEDGGRTLLGVSVGSEGSRGAGCGCGLCVGCREGYLTCILARRSGSLVRIHNSIANWVLQFREAAVPAAGAFIHT